jgi:multiple sugar transport system ATP-binding protein
MTVARNMSFSLRLARLPKAQIAERVERAAKILGISELLDRYPRQLSGGQRQRVAMGRAIVRDPEVFLFDEPLSNLDAKLRVQMRMEIKSLHQRLRTTTIYVTHDQVEAMTMADRIVVMQGGIVEQAGTPMEVYNAPANLFVASFIGSPTINLLPGKVEVDGAGGYRFRSDRGWAIALPDAQALLGRRVVLGLRPEHFVLQPGGTKAQVVLVEPTGSETQLHLRIGEDEVTAAFRDRILPAPGDTLELAWDPRDIHLFDEETGRRLATAGRVIPAMPRPAAQLHVLPVTGRS